MDDLMSQRRIRQGACILVGCLVVFSFSHCKYSRTEDSGSRPTERYAPASSTPDDDKDGEGEDGEKANAEERDADGCSVEDGAHSATIYYTNPSTGYSATYTLDVEVEGCQVTRIDFNNGGYLGLQHITAADIDEDRDATVVDDRGRSFEVHIDD